MAMEITNNYSSYAAQTMTESGATANSAKKKEQKNTGNSRKQQIQSTTEYANGLAKLVPKRRVLRLEMPVHQPETASH